MLLARNATSESTSLGLESWEYWRPHLIDARRLQRKIDALDKSRRLGVSALGAGGHSDSRFDIWCLLTSEIVKALDFLNDSTRETISQATKRLLTLSTMTNVVEDDDTEIVWAQERSEDSMNALACLCLSFDNMTRFELLNAALASHYAAVVVSNEGGDQSELWSQVIFRRVNAVVDVHELSRIREALTKIISLLIPFDADTNPVASLCGVCCRAVAVGKVGSDDVLHCVSCFLQAFHHGKLSQQSGCDLESELQVLSLLSGRRKLDATSNLIVAMERFRRLEEERSGDAGSSKLIEESGNSPSSTSSMKSGASCHQCKNHKKPYELVYCQSAGVCNEPSPNASCSTTVQLRACNKKFCDKCLLRYYENTGTVDRHCWTCPACRGICNCAACKRRKRRKTNPIAAVNPSPPPLVKEETLVDMDAEMCRDLEPDAGPKSATREKTVGMHSLWALGQEESLSILGDSSNELHGGTDFLAWNNDMCA